MTATNIFQQKQRWNQVDGVRTPKLEYTPDALQNLFIYLGKSRHIERFSANYGAKITVLRIWLRPGESQNIVTIATIKSMFRKFPKTKFPIDFESRIVEIQIPMGI